MHSSKLKPASFFDFGAFAHSALFDNCHYAWDGLRNIKGYLKQHLQENASAVDCFQHPLPHTVVLWQGRVWREGFELLGGDVTKGAFRLQIEGEEIGGAVVLYAGSILWDRQIFLGPGSVVEPGALIQGPTIIGAHTEVRQGAYVRGNCIIGDRCVVGHTTEITASIMLNDAKAGHFAYIGDSILGNATNLGAGTKLANLKIKTGTVRVKCGSDSLDTGLRKFGAVLGDHVEIGCNAVTNPGTVLGRGCLVFPVTSVPSGYHEPESIVR
jgi:UDP-N-acetylglucosamine diphosphorylase / glucose-1-phosphate thymidylyltransferase / UDP-N-acetylgalactosamine diphosphorylase / glucosamine-1-phosphate N-acetyltransferase / galactosamine-1-phosphate N-acetyltransferase